MGNEFTDWHYMFQGAWRGSQKNNLFSSLFTDVCLLNPKTYAHKHNSRKSNSMSMKAMSNVFRNKWNISRGTCCATEKMASQTPSYCRIFVYFRIIYIFFLVSNTLAACGKKTHFSAEKHQKIYIFFIYARSHSVCIFNFHI